MDQAAHDELMRSTDQTPLPQHVRQAVNYIRAHMAEKIVDGGLNPRLFGDFAVWQHGERRRYVSGVSAI
jgi:hypothetical protein